MTSQRNRIFKVRIAEGEHPQDIKESDYFTERGEFRVDSEGSPTLLNCLMYKLSYYRLKLKLIQSSTLVSYIRVAIIEI